MDPLETHKKNLGKIEIATKTPLSKKEDLSIIYTPGVAKVSERISGHPEEVNLYTNKKNTVAIITDGSAVLGLGDIGPVAALPVMEGKSVLFKEFANIDAYPILLNTNDVDEMVETIINISPTFSGINLEDISAPRCFDIEKRLTEKLNIPVFHDDQHGTAIAILAALINALKVANKKMESIKIVINGAGAAGIATQTLLLKYGAKKICLLDSKGAICKRRSDLSDRKKELLHGMDCPCGGLEVSLEGVDVFIGVSKGNVLNEKLIKKMASNPIIFAMANPDPEISYDDAKKAGALVAATGRSDFPNQINNGLVFPGFFRGLLDNNIHKVTDEMKIEAAIALSDCVKNINEENIIPDIMNKTIHTKVADSIKKFAKKWKS